MNTPPTSRQSGFTLVEIALAMLVLAVGMVVLVGLFPAGLTVNKRSIDETRAAIFAEEVLNAVKAAAAETPWSQINTMEIIPPAADIWRNPNALKIRSGPAQQVNRYIYDRASNVGDVETAVMKFKLRIQDSRDRMRKEVTLQVVNGEYARFEDARIYYTELFYNGL